MSCIVHTDMRSSDSFRQAILSRGLHLLDASTSPFRRPGAPTSLLLAPVHPLRRHCPSWDARIFAQRKKLWHGVICIWLVLSFSPKAQPQRQPQIHHRRARVPVECGKMTAAASRRRCRLCFERVLLVSCLDLGCIWGATATRMVVQFVAHHLSNFFLQSTNRLISLSKESSRD